MNATTLPVSSRIGPRNTQPPAASGTSKKGPLLEFAIDRIRTARQTLAVGLVMMLATTVSIQADEIPPENMKALQQQLVEIDAGIAGGPYRAAYEDLVRHEAAPGWFLDGKFGIYFHWGVYTVPGIHAWYVKRMHVQPGSDVEDRHTFYEHHVKTYGTPEEYPYHYFIPQFTAEHFDADEWARLFLEAGAKYAGPVAAHHDTFAMWDSDITPWNAARMGPKRDITGELAHAIKKRGMKFVTTFHNERSQSWMPRVPGTATVSTDPQLRMLYANVSSEFYGKIFLGELGEVIDKYQPDLIWFDGAMSKIHPASIHEKFLAYYFNKAHAWGRDVVVNTKKHNYPTKIAVEDHERGGTACLAELPWLSDDTVGSGWAYRWAQEGGYQVRPAGEIIRGFMSIISKNGCLLFNIAPTADGRIPDDQREVLREIGDWLRINGEAVYETRPWLAFGEGPNRRQGSGKGSKAAELDQRDVRYTRAKDDSAVFATIMGWNDTFRLVAPKAGNPKGQVTLLGHGPVEFEVDQNGHLTIEFPDVPEDKRPCRHAFCFKLTGFDLGLQPHVDKSWQLVKAADLAHGGKSIIGPDSSSR